MFLVSTPNVSARLSRFLPLPPLAISHLSLAETLPTMPTVDPVASTVGTDHSNAAKTIQQKPSQGTRNGKDSEKEEEHEHGPGPIRTSRTPNHRVKKLIPPRPYPTVPAGVSATGPRSAHHEGKNYITITRKTKLGSYLRRCKDVVLKDGCVRSITTAR